MRFTILIVEDDPDSRTALALLLELEGFKVITASDGIIALELAEKHQPDLIITDICMPGMSGIELTRRIRTISKFDSLPIIAITAAAEQSQRNVLDAGAYACLVKPLDLAALSNITDNLLVRANSI